MNIAQHEIECFQAHRAVAWKERIEISNSRREPTPFAELERRVNLLRQAVERNGLSHSDIAKRLGVSKGVVSSWSMERAPVPPRHLAKLEKMAGGGV